MFGHSGSSILKYGQDTEYIGTWDLVIRDVPWKVCGIVWRTLASLRSLVWLSSIEPNHRWWWFHDREAPSVIEEDSSWPTKAKDLLIRSKVNIITIKHSNTNMAEKTSFTYSVLFWWLWDYGMSGSEINKQPIRVLLDMQINFKASLSLYSNNNNNNHHSLLSFQLWASLRYRILWPKWSPFSWEKIVLSHPKHIQLMLC